MTNPLANLTTIRDNFSDLVTPHGLRIAMFLVIPGDEPEGPHYCQVMMTTDGQAPDEMDRKFNEMVKEEAKQKRAADREAHFAAAENEDIDEIMRDLDEGLL